MDARRPSRKAEREDPNEIQPYWLAARVIGFTAETSWSENFILVWLPVPRGEQYYHALLKRSGFRTYPRQATETNWLPAAPTEEPAMLPPLEDDAELAEAMRRFGLDTPAAS